MYTSALTTYLNNLFVTTTTTIGKLSAIALPSILVDGVVSVAGQGGLVALLRAAHLEKPVIARRAFGVLADSILVAVLGDHIFIGSAEYYLVRVALWRLENRIMVIAGIRGRGDGWRRRGTGPGRGAPKV